MNFAPTSSADGRPRQGVLSRIWSFLNRDVRTLKWSGQGEVDSGMVPSQPQATEKITKPAMPIASEVDPRRIEGLRFRRSLLDWRDDFQWQVTETATQGYAALTKQVEDELANMNLVRRWLFTKRASEVLTMHIDAYVRVPMGRASQIGLRALREHRSRQTSHQKEVPYLNVMWNKLDWDTRLSMKFAPENREQILGILSDLILGENGLAAQHRQRATQAADQILEIRNAQSDSI